MARPTEKMDGCYSQKDSFFLPRNDPIFFSAKKSLKKTIILGIYVLNFQTISFLEELIG